MATKVQWETVKGHAGLQFRKFGTTEFSFRFRQRQHAIDFLGVMSMEKAIRIAAELRENRATGAGPQTWKDMTSDRAEQVQQAAIVEKRERKKIIAAETFAQANTVSSFWDGIYWPMRANKPKTNKRSNDSLLYMFDKWIRPAVGHIPLQELTFSDIEKMLDTARAAGRSTKTVNEIYGMLRTVWGYAQVYFSVHNAVNLPLFPGKILSLPRDNNEKTCWLEKEEASKLLNTLYHWHDIQKSQGIWPRGRDTKEIYGIAVLSLLSGLRFGDIAKLKWKDVQAAIAYARDPKSGRAYGIHIDLPLVREMFTERKTLFPDASPDDFVFKCWKTGGPWGQVPAAYREAVEYLKINEAPHRLNNPLERIDFHSLRHTFASWLAMSGVNLHTIMVLLDHHDIRQTLRYARLNPSYTRKPVHELAEGFAREHVIDGQYAYVPTQPTIDTVSDVDRSIFELEK